MKPIKTLLAFICISANTILAQTQLPQLIPYCKDGKWGYCDSLKNIIIPCEYDFVNLFQNDFAVVKNCINQECLKGVINTKGKLICPIQYDKIEDFNEFGVAKVYCGENLGIIDKSGKEIVPCVYTPGLACNKDLTKIFLDGKIGLLNYEGVVSLPAQYDYVACDERRLKYKIPIIKFKLNEKYGFADSIGNVLLPPQYDYIIREINHYVILKNSDKFALYDKTNGKEIFPCKYDNISIIGEKEGQNTYLLLMINNYWGVADSKGKIILPLEYDNINVLGDIFQVRKEGENFLYNNRGEKLPVKKYEIVEWLNPYKVRMNGKWGVIDSTGYEIIPCQYDNVMYQRNIDAIIAVNDNKYGLFTKQGEEIVPCVYDPIKDYYDYYKTKQTLVVSQNKKYGLINSELRKEIIPCEYHSISTDYSNTDYYRVYAEKNFKEGGLFDKTGKMILSCEYKHISSIFHSNIVGVTTKDDKWGFYNIESGEWFIPLGKYQGWTQVSGNNLFVLKKGDKWGLIDSTGQKELSEFKYDNIYDNVRDFYYMLSRNKNFLKTHINSRYGVISRQGEEIIPCNYDYEITNYDTFFFVKKNDKWGVINNKGKILQDCVYSEEEIEGWRNRNRWIIIKKNGRLGAINANGKIIVKPIYRKITHDDWLTTMMSIQCKDMQWGVVDSTGRVIIPCLYTNVKPLDNGLIAVQLDNLWGVRDLQNKEILACEYKNMEIAGLNLNDNEDGYRNFENDNFIRANKDGEWGLFSKDGAMLIPLKYKYVTVLSKNLYVAHGKHKDEFYNSKGVKIASIQFEEENEYNYEESEYEEEGAEESEYEEERYYYEIGRAHV